MGQVERISGGRATDPMDFVTLGELQDLIAVMADGSHLIPLQYTNAQFQEGLSNGTIMAGSIVYISDSEPPSLVLVNSAQNLTSIPYEKQTDGSIDIDVKWLCLQLVRHIQNDLDRWQNALDTIIASENRMMALIQSISATSVGNYDYSNPTVIVGTGGLISVSQNRSVTIPANGAIKCNIGGLLSTSIVVNRNDSPIWTSPILLLGSTIGDPNPSDYIPVAAGDIVTVSGSLGLGQVLNVTFYPNKT
jgi:hypothetical protein